jgi:t-SNARE complex subunit (syntaxin)
VDAKENALKGENEIKIAERESRGVTRKVLWLIFIVCFVILSIVLLIIFFNL